MECVCVNNKKIKRVIETWKALRKFQRDSNARCEESRYLYCAHEDALLDLEGMIDDSRMLELQAHDTKMPMPGN